MSRIALVSLSALVLTIPCETAAQLVVPESAPRTRVLLRDRAADGIGRQGWLVGTVVASTVDSVVFEVARTGERLALSREEINRMQASYGRTDRRKQAARIGAAAGMLAGAAVGLQSGERSCRTEYLPFPGAGPIPYETCDSGWSVGRLAGGALAGAAVGYLLGMTIGEGMSSERWQDVSVSTRLQVSPVSSRALVSFAW